MFLSCPSGYDAPCRRARASMLHNYASRASTICHMQNTGSSETKALSCKQLCKSSAISRKSWQVMETASESKINCTSCSLLAWVFTSWLQLSVYLHVYTSSACLVFPRLCPSAPAQMGEHTGAAQRCCRGSTGFLQGLLAPTCYQQPRRCHAHSSSLCTPLI